MNNLDDIKTRIETECAALSRLLVAKNTAYGKSSMTPPVLLPTLAPETAIFVRMSDKIARLQTLLTGADANDETFDDTMRDLAGYCILYLSMREGETK